MQGAYETHWYCRPRVLPRSGNGICQDTEHGAVLDLTSSLGKAGCSYQWCWGPLPSAWLVPSMQSECASPGPVPSARKELTCDFRYPDRWTPPSSSRRPCPQCCLPLPSPTAFCSWPQDLTGCKVVCHQGSLSLLPVSLFSKIWLRVDVGQGCWWGDVDGDENGSQ